MRLPRKNPQRPLARPARAATRTALGRVPLMLVALALLTVPACTSRGESENSAAKTGVVSILGGDAPEGYLPVVEGPPITFPPDHGAHPAQQIEWWYTTMNLESAETAGSSPQRFGVEVTFFRFGLDAPVDPSTRGSDWGTRDLYMAHFAVTDARGGRFRSFERFTRGAIGLAGAEADPWRVWNESWSLSARDGGPTPFPIELRALDRTEEGTVSIDLTLTGSAPPILQGNAGFSRKGPEPGNASRYYSYPSLEVSGTLTFLGTSHAVTGTAWFDHEWSTNVLGEDLVGWDWFALQFDDGSRLMVYELRRGDGSRSEFGAGTWIAADHSTRALRADEIVVTVLDRWTSTASGIEYPARWRIEVPPLALHVSVTPIVADQELRLSTQYWEGAVDSAGTIDRRPLSGWGYVELVGYGEKPPPRQEGSPPERPKR